VPWPPRRFRKAKLQSGDGFTMNLKTSVHHTKNGGYIKETISYGASCVYPSGDAIQPPVKKTKPIHRRDTEKSEKKQSHLRFSRFLTFSVPLRLRAWFPVFAACNK
jgi:hypothetical protein